MTVTATRDASMWQRGSFEPERRAVVEPDGKVFTYGDLQQRINQWSNAILEVGVPPGARVALASPNCFEWLAVVGACLQIGVRCVPVNFHLTGEEIAYIVSDSAAAMLIVHQELAEVGSHVAEVSGLSGNALVAIGEMDGYSAHEELLAAQSKDRPHRLMPGEKMYYTSGTTGRPKGVLRPMPTADDVDTAAVAAAKKLFADTGRFPDGSGAVLVPGPLYHGAPLGSAVGALHLGQTVVLMGKWTPEGFLDSVSRYRVTSTTMVPTMFERLLKLPEDVRKSYDVSSLQSVTHAGAPCAPGTKRAMIEWLGPILNEYYAASEGGGTRVTSEEWLQRPGTVGRPTTTGGIRILDDEGTVLPPNEPGRVFMKLNRPFEYLGDKDKTASAISDGYFTVGDIGYVDDDGYLFLCDRSADTIISGGVNIYPAEIEAALSSHPLVHDVAVIGVPNAEWGEEVKAVVQLRDGIAGDEQVGQELIDYVRDRVARFKVPRSIDFVEALPRAENGKLYKRRIRDGYWQNRDRSI
ncbi:AMP-binding protein [Nocardia sp. alder85J]|uniref:AMP-binding protein n=1 Tax=Nocardia sp. alder85J TaxID=2862949 RepID=UPI001CD5EADB|nr:AMP-binding protein [Nocardia sp. alder85J]MCX4095638.1 AMP-binding protein [Nocardia sp. alder85J]